MSRWNAYLNTGKRIVEDYNGRTPLAVWLKDFFREHKQMGSRDRKIISEEVYSFYRLGHSAPDLSIENKLLCSLFLCGTASNELLAYFKPAWNDNIHISLPDKMKFLQAEGLRLQAENIFPWQDFLSNNIDKELFNRSYLHQPDLFLRIRPQNKTIVEQKLNAAAIPFTRLTETCIAMPNASKIDQVLKIDEEVVVQDYSSQKVGEFFKFKSDRVDDTNVSTWDCCAGSGGKSIMAFDQNPDISLTVSDSRPAIIDNLKKRFQRAGINNYRSFVADLTISKNALPGGQYETIIADVPCSGSGTWSRTPEQLYFFTTQKIKYYSDLQKNIVSRVSPRLKNNGRLVYITCSVFKQENEEMVDFILANSELKLEVTALLEGYEMKADSMFVAVLCLNHNLHD